jgi:hypothetical protein
MYRNFKVRFKVKVNIQFSISNIQLSLMLRQAGCPSMAWPPHSGRQGDSVGVGMLEAGMMDKGFNN